MKLRIKGNTIRLRLTKTEVEQFGREGLVSELVQFGPKPAQQFRYEILAHPGIEQLSANYENHAIQVMVPKSLAEKWVHNEEVGFEHELKHEGGSLHLLVEKDFQCLNRDNAEEPDNYEHPLAR